MRRAFAVCIVVAGLVCPASAFAQAPGTPIDPTKNVLDLVAAQEKLRDSLRDADNRFQAALRDAETRRVNELATQKQQFDLELSKLLREGAEKQATLLATQLKEVKTDLSDRVARLEQFRWESGGRGDVVSWLPALMALLISVSMFAFFLIDRRKQPPLSKAR